MVAVVSSHSVAKEWPIAEVNTALALEISGQKRVLPVMVGQPDLSKLPLIRGKNWLVWDGDADRVARQLRDLIKPPAEAKPGQAGSDGTAPGQPAQRPGPWDASAPKPVVEPAPARSWLANLFGKD